MSQHQSPTPPMLPSPRARYGPLGARPPVAGPGQRIGLLGGSFNPPHTAHLLISRTALKRLGLDRVWWMVTPGNPLKSRSELAPLEERLGLARALARSTPRIIVTGFEKDLSGRYTVETLEYLRTRYPRVRFVWLMGADCLAEFDRWRAWRTIFRLMPIAVVDRPGFRLKSLASPAARGFGSRRWPETRARGLPLAKPPAWTFLAGPLSGLSSTALRADLREAEAKTRSSA